MKRKVVEESKNQRQAASIIAWIDNFWLRLNPSCHFDSFAMLRINSGRNSNLTRFLTSSLTFVRDRVRNDSGKDERNDDLLECFTSL